MKYKNVILEKKNRIAKLTLNRPQARNALDAALAQDIKSALEEIRHDESVDVVIFTGSGNSFCAGMDVKAVTAPRGKVVNPLPIVRDVFDLMESLEQPIIVAVNGYAVTGGFELALAGDIIIASENAVFRDTHALLGVIPGGRNTQRLPRLVGAMKAKELLFTGEPISAIEAERIGMINHVVPLEKLQEAAQEMADKVLRADVVAVKKIKSLVNQGLLTDLKAGILLEKLAFARLDEERDPEATRKRWKTYYPKA
jgi:enoyl-CoA hydratase/carnithine racemase